MLEDQRSAIATSVALSSQLIAAALIMLTVAGAFTTFVLDRKVIGPPFWIFTAGCFLFFAISIFAGGKGITVARDSDSGGTWTLASGKKWFNRQATTCVLGLLLFAASLLFSGRSKDDSSRTMLAAVVSNISVLATKTAEIAAHQENYEQQLAKLEQVARDDVYKKDLQQEHSLREQLEREQEHLTTKQESQAEQVTELNKAVVELQKTLKQKIHELRQQIKNRRGKEIRRRRVHDKR